MDNRHYFLKVNDGYLFSIPCGDTLLRLENKVKGTSYADFTFNSNTSPLCHNKFFTDAEP